MNRMCLNCKCLGNDCNGTDNRSWTGCVYRKSDNGDADLCSSLPIIGRDKLEEKNVLVSKLPVYKLGVI